MSLFKDIKKAVRTYKKVTRNIEKASRTIEKTQKARQQFKTNKAFSDVDRMTGVQFEDYLAYLFEKQGYKVQPTKTSGDYGADLVMIKNGVKVVVQAKRYSKNIGVSAVQEIVSAKAMYNAHEAWVVTNQYFTQNAKNLAQANGVRLIDREILYALNRH